MISSMSEDELRAGIKGSTYELAAKFSEIQDRVNAQKGKPVQPLIPGEKQGEKTTEAEELKDKGIVP